MILAWKVVYPCRGALRALKRFVNSLFPWQVNC